MGESLRRKLFSRMRRTKTQASISSSLRRQPNRGQRAQELAAFSFGGPQLPSSEELAEWPPQRPANSASTPQLAMIRKQQQQQQRALAQEQPSSTTGHVEPAAASSSALAASGEEARTSTSLGAAGPRAGTATPSQPALATSSPPPPPQSNTARKTRGKLRSASRAIQFFRRTASSLTSSSSSGLLVSGGGGRISRQDTGDSQQSGGTAGAGPARPASSASSHALCVLLSSSASSNVVGASSSNGAGANHAGQASAPHAHSGAKANNGCEMLPQFIVPRLNALRLPLVCLIKSLDGELMREVFVHRYELGQYLIESLKVSLGANDCKYFGLKLAKSLDEQEDLRNPWLDLNESVCKQIKTSAKLGLFQTFQASANSSSSGGASSFSAPTGAGANGAGSSARSIEFYLRIKFYPPNLARVQDSFLRNYLWLQLRRDLRLGKLTSSMNNLTLLMACVLQFELGDHKQELLDRVPELSILPNQDLIEEPASELWRSRLRGLKRHQAQMQFLRAAVILETYGFDYWPVRDHQRQRAYLLGFNYAGIKTIRNGRIVHHFRWHSLSKISYERRMIIFHIYPAENSKRKQILGFKCLSNEDCQNLYMRLLEQKYFFTVDLAYFDKSLRRPSCLYAPAASNNANCDTLDWFDEADPSNQSSPTLSATHINSEPAERAGQAGHESPVAPAAAPEANNQRGHSDSRRPLAQQAPAPLAPKAPTVCPARCPAGCQFCTDDEQQQPAPGWSPVVPAGQQDCCSQHQHSPQFEQNSSAWSSQQQQAAATTPATTCQLDFRGQQQQQQQPSSHRRPSRLHRQQSTMEYISSSDDQDERREGAAGGARAGGPRGFTGRRHSDNDASQRGPSGAAWSLWSRPAGKRLSIGAWLSGPIGRLRAQVDWLGQWLMRVVESMLAQSHACLSAHCRQRANSQEGAQSRHRPPMTSCGGAGGCGGANDDDDADDFGDDGDDIDANDDEHSDDNDDDQQQEQQPRRLQRRRRQRDGSPQVGSFDFLVRFCLLLLLLNFVLRVGENFWTSLLEMLAFGRDDGRSYPALIDDEQQLIDEDL